MVRSLVTHRNVFLLGLAGFCFGLSISVFVISVSQFLLAANWLVSRDFSAKWDRLKSNRAVWAIWAFFLLHVIGLFYSTDLQYGLDDVRKKLPLLLMPLFIGSEKRISQNELNSIFFILTSGIVVSTGISHFKYFQNSIVIGYDVRDAFVFVPPIRLGLIMDLSISWLITILSRKRERFFIKVLALLTLLYLLFTLIHLQLITALVVLPFALLFGLGFSGQLSSTLLKVRSIIMIVLVVLIAGALFKVYEVAKPFLDFKPAQMGELEDISPSNNMYLHQYENQMLENGNQVWIYIDDKAVRREWNKRSAHDFDGQGNTGEPIRATLYRYMTSKNLRKDMNGMKMLNDQDIYAVEHGITNIKYADNKSIEKRLYATIWELNNYFHKAGSNEGYSFARRLEFWKTGLQATSGSLIFGAGTGDVRLKMNKQYDKNQTQLSENARLKPHNQFITTSLALGLTGLLLLLLCFLVALKTHKLTSYHIAFVVIILLSFLTEDTIEGQVGASLFSGFYALFFCQAKSEIEN